MNSKISIGDKTILWHIFGIAFYIIFEIVYLSYLGMGRSLQSLIIGYSYEITFFYFSVRYFLPNVWSKTSNGLFRLLYIILIIGAYSLFYCLVGLINISIRLDRIVTELSTASIIASSWRAFYITLIAIAYSFAEYSIAKTKEAQANNVKRVEAETKMENNFIRSQVNPHLLYNSLSFLYTKTLKEVPEIANTVHLLVGMTEYALANEKEDDVVLLEDEIRQMERYIELQQTLHSNRLQVSINKSLHSDNENIFVPPLLFINFIENVFKYGDLNDPLMPAVIDLHLAGSTLLFLASNKVANFQQYTSNGIGLPNAQARIKKHYRDQSEIQIVQTGNLYTVEIIIRL